MIGLGAMRLSTERDRDEARAIAVLHVAFDAGVRFIDTADAYGWNDEEIGHNERLIARALAAWSGDRTRIHVATKGGLTRPGGLWMADGRARHLAAACEASCRALDVRRIHLYQLHAPDPRTPLATSVRALAALQKDGLIERVGLCNVTVGQIEAARRLVEIASVQVELSVWNDDGLLSGVAAYCASHAIQLIAHRPLGGPQRRRRTESDPVLADLAARHGVSPFDIALAWLLDLAGVVVPIPGATRAETAAAIPRAQTVTLTDEDRAALDERFPAGRLVRTGRNAPIGSRAATRADGELVLIMGLPAAGKSTLARTFAERGYTRINRDDEGGSLRGLLPAIDRLAEAGTSRIVLDNTYVSRKARGAVLQAAGRAGLPVRCIWLATRIEDAQVNAAWRMLRTFGRLLGPDEMRNTVKHDVSAFGPAVQFRYQRELEPPDASEGFSAIEIRPFERTHDPSGINRAVIVWCDGMPEDAAALARRGHVLREYADRGYRLLGIGWQPGIADGTITIARADATYSMLRHRLGVAMDIQYCRHGGGPPACWCRKPLPGLGVAFIQKYQLDPRQCIYVGDGAQDPGFARRLGFQFQTAAAFFER